MCSTREGAETLVHDPDRVRLGVPGHEPATVAGEDDPGHVGRLPEDDAAR